MHISGSFVYKARARLLLVASMLAGICLYFMPLASAANISIGGPSDCDNNAVIRCGAHSVSALVGDYQSSSYVQKVYGAFGISSSDMNNLSSTAVSGTVTKGGNVFVDGQSSPVARNAITGGRQNMPGSTAVTVQGATFFRRPPRVSFQQQSLPAFVSMVNGQFRFAIIASCGNAVAAVAVPVQKPAVMPAPVTSPPATPMPTPTPTPAPTMPVAPTQTQSQSQSQNVTQSQQVTVQAPTPSAPTTTTPAVTQTTTPAMTTTPTTTTPPVTTTATLPNTGPGDVVGLFLASGLTGFLGYRRFLLYKLGH